MRELLAELDRWWADGDPVGMATVIRTWRSAPRPVGSAMAVGPDGSAVGSVSGGCVEGAVYDLATTVAHTGQPALKRYGVSDDDAFAVGLTCGGMLDVYVERVCPRTFPEFGAVAEAVRTSRPVAMATCVDEPAPAGRIGRRLVVFEDSVLGTLGDDALDEAVAGDSRGLLGPGVSAARRFGPGGAEHGDDLTVFVSVFRPRPRMIVFGAIDFAAAVARQGALLGYDVTVCDARSAFATTRRFPDADQVVVDWPDRYLRAEAEAGRVDDRTVICVLTHDPKFDVPALEIALRLPVGYVGALGSRHTHEDRVRRLRTAGLSAGELGRLCAPIGLDLGGRTPEETAVSIAAEIIALRNGGTGARLAVGSGSIHR